MKIECPVCKRGEEDCLVCEGKGELDPPNEGAEKLKRKEEAVITLHEAGYLHREIVKMLHYKNVSSVTYILKKYQKK